jgi:hypothetical protein
MFVSLYAVSGAWAGEKKVIKVRAQLVFGSDEQDFGRRVSDLSKVDKELEKRLKSVFRWEHYWEKNQEQNKKAIALTEDKPEKVKLTDRTTVEITYLNDGDIKAQLFLDGVSWVTQTRKLSPSGMIVMASDAGDMNAWFVIVTHHKQP